MCSSRTLTRVVLTEISRHYSRSMRATRMNRIMKRRLRKSPKSSRITSMPRLLYPWPPEEYLRRQCSTRSRCSTTAYPHPYPHPKIRLNMVSRKWCRQVKVFSQSPIQSKALILLRHNTHKVLEWWFHQIVRALTCYTKIPKAFNKIIISSRVGSSHNPINTCHKTFMASSSFNSNSRPTNNKRPAKAQVASN